jgi:serine protease AprX
MREISIKNKNDDAIKIVVGVSLTLITTFVFAVVILWAVSTIGGTILGLNPPQALVTWEDEYRDITGINSVENLDGTGVTLCIVDSGINIEHPDLANINLIGWKDVINTMQTPYDDDGHGTAMAGIIVADGGLNGVSKNVDLLIAKAIDDTGSGTDDGIAEAVNWCTTEGADIISLSLGGAQGFGSSIITTDSLETAVENAIENGVYVVAAAGNDGGENDDGDVSSPGSVDDVICVGGITRLGNLWVGSSEGDNNGDIWPPKLPRNDPDKKPEIVAPGHEVPVLVFNGESWWGWSSGTSASTAWVSGSLDQPHQDSPLKTNTGTSCPGATISGFLSGSFLGSLGGQISPLLSPSELPTHKFPSLVIPPTQITSSTEPGEDTSPSSFSPSFPAAATT